MNSAEELRVVRHIKWKQRKRLPLTLQEQTILAYSPYGTANACTCHSKKTVALRG